MSPILLLSITGTFVAIAAATGAIAYTVLEKQAPGRKRLQEAVAGKKKAAAAPAVLANLSLTDKPSRTTERIASFVPKSPSEMNKLRRRLVRAGYHSLKSALVFSIAELALPLVLGGALYLLAGGGGTGVLLGVFAGFAGFMVPSLVLGRLIEQRRLAITNGLPDVLDLLIVCLEAGCALDQAIVKASEELSLTYPALGEELKMLSTETRAGKPRIEAFRNLEARTKNEDIRSLVAMLVQTDRFGTSVSQALRTFAEVARTKRRQRAEESAAKIGVKMVFPLVLCLFPALYVVILGPAVIQMVKVFGQIGGQ
jgi:tight adherence protein C